jgi:hypothetical protein
MEREKKYIELAMELTYRYDHSLVGFILAELLILGGKVQPIL